MENVFPAARFPGRTEKRKEDRRGAALFPSNRYDRATGFGGMAQPGNR